MKKNLLEDITRLKIITFLVNSQRTFNEIKNKFNLTDGNLSSHLKKFEKENFIKIRKDKFTFVDITKKGENELKKHITFLEKLIKQI